MFVVLSLSLFACDVNEGPVEETREAAMAIEKGRPADEIVDQVKDIGAQRSELDKQLTDVETWFEDQRDKLLKDPQPTQATRDELDRIDLEMKSIRAQLDTTDDRTDWQRMKAKVADTVNDVENRIGALGHKD